MDKARTFFYVSAGVFLLALTLVLGFHLGARSATAQAPGNPVVATDSGEPYFVLTANGDVYYSGGARSGIPYTLVNNVFSGPTAVQRETWGSLKARYRGEPGRE